MIEELINQEHYQEALDKLEGLNDDISIYQKIVCYYGLKRLNDAYYLSKVALEKVEKNYYDILTLHIAILIEMEKDEEAYSILEEELQMPYIPSKYQAYLEETYEMLYRKNLQANKQYNVFDNYKDDEIKDLLIKEKEKSLILILLDQLQKRNIRMYLSELKYILKSKEYSNDIKSIILELLQDQDVLIEIEMLCNDQEILVDISSLTPLLSQISIEEILKIIEDKCDEKDISIFNSCQDILIAYHASIYPLAIEEDEYNLVAAGIYYYALTNYGIDMDLDEIALKFGISSVFLEPYYENICKLSIF